MEENKNLEETQNEEVVEETKEEIVEVKPEVEQVQTAEVVDDEPEDEGFETPLFVTLESMKEFYLKDGILGYVKSGVIWAALIALITYWLTKNNESFSFVTIGVYAGIMFFFHILSYFIQKCIVVPKQFVKNDMNKLGIIVKVTNKGIKQSLGDKDYKIPWTIFTLCKETDKSFCCYGGRSGGFLLSKDNLTPEQISYFSAMASEKVFSYKNKTTKK